MTTQSATTPQVLLARSENKVREQRQQIARLKTLVKEVVSEAWWNDEELESWRHRLSAGRPEGRARAAKRAAKRGWKRRTCSGCKQRRMCHRVPDWLGVKAFWCGDCGANLLDR